MFAEGFPEELKIIVDRAERRLPRQTGAALRMSNDKITCHLRGKPILFPYRVYFPEQRALVLLGLSETEKMAIDCIYTRHCDGRVRQKHIAALLSSKLPFWTIPYVFKCCDDYVIEILQLIYDKLTMKDTVEFRRFCQDNRRSFYSSYHRMVSYWNAYYRHEHERLEDYVGWKLFSECLGATRAMDKFNYLKTIAEVPLA